MNKEIIVKAMLDENLALCGRNVSKFVDGSYYSWINDGKGYWENNDLFNLLSIDFDLKLISRTSDEFKTILYNRNPWKRGCKEYEDYKLNVENMIQTYKGNKK